MKIVSCNIEKNYHYDRLKDFLAIQNTEVFCAQEVFQEDVESIAQDWGFEDYIYEPMTIDRNSGFTQGVAIFSKTPIERKETSLLGDFDDPLLIPQEKRRDPHSVNWKSITAYISDVPIVCTHGPVTWEGSQTTDYQRLWCDRLLSSLEKNKTFVLCADLNAPRGYEIWSLIASKYRDNIPVHYKTSIDNQIHKAGHKNLQYVVDCVFTKDIEVGDVDYHSGVSDHFAVSFCIQ